MAARRSKGDTILILRFSALGDVAMTIPPVYDLCRAFPDKTFVFVTRTRMAGMFVNAPDNLIVEGVNLGNYRGIGGMRRLARQLQEKYTGIEAVIDLHDVLRTKLLRFFIRRKGVRVSVIDKGRKEKKALVRHGARRYAVKGGEPLPTTEQRYRAAIQAAGYDAPSRFTSLFPVGKGHKGAQRVGIAPFAAHKGKIYPPDKMAQVVDLLADEGREVYLFGAGEEEKRVLDSWVKGRSNVVNMSAASKGLAEEMELMSGLDVMVSMDSGNMHLAAVAGTPRIVSLWGATHPSAGFSPFRVGSADMVQLDMDCRPCSVYGNRPCRRGDYACLNGITPGMLLDKILNQ